MAGKFHLSPFRWFFIILLVLGGIGVSYLVSQGLWGHGTTAGKRDAGGVYAADIPLDTMPEKLYPGLVLLSVEDLLRVPETDGFQWPCGSPQGAMVYDAQPFGSDNAKRGGKHTGADLNGIGGENTDDGWPVRAAARGLVVYAGKPSEDWGNVVILAHRLPGTDRVIQTFYAHLKEICVRRGELVARGRRIGAIGTADGHYLAHLHFEVIESRCTEAGMPGYHRSGTMNRLDPETFISQHPAPDMPDVYDSVRKHCIHAWGAGNTPSIPNPALPAGTLPVNPAQYTKP